VAPPGAIDAGTGAVTAPEEAGADAADPAGGKVEACCAMAALAEAAMQRATQTFSNGFFLHS
jgi:hypothetical protein